MIVEAEEPGRKTANQTTAAHEALREEILSGRLRPGERLTAEALRQRFGLGVSPIREALNRLLSEGLVALEEQKGFRVAPVSAAELDELLMARTWIDGAAVAQSIARYDRAWENGLVLAYHHLSRAERRAGAAITDNSEWEGLHRAFHLALVSGCGSRPMVRTCQQLFDAAERYRRLAADAVPERNELDEHRAIVEACFDRDAARAADLLERHYRRTYEVIAGAMAREG